MRSIGINAQLLTREHGYRGAGISSYLWRLLRGLAQCESDHTFTVFHSAPLFSAPADWPTSMQARPTRWPMRQPLTRLAWEEFALPCAARSLDLLHAPINTLPHRLPCPAVVTVHDLAFLRFPAVVSGLRRRYLTHAVGHAVQHAERVIAVSDCTRRDILAAWDVPPERVRVVHPAIDPAMRPCNDAAALAEFARAQDLHQPYILFLGTLEPRKNLVNLLDAFALARDRGLRLHRLVLAGAQDWQGGRYFAELCDHIRRRHLQDQVRLPGYIPDELRSLWYNGATAVVLPSWYEGFGFPAAEALACGVPVVASNAGSLPEVVGAHGRLCDPADVAAWAEALLAVVNDAGGRSRCQTAAEEYHSHFTEIAMGIATLKVYDSVTIHTG